MGNLIYIYFIIINIIGFYFMYIDKRKAIKNEWRISESTLISIAIIGGSLGSLLGMYTFRHKTKHPKFTIGIPFIILLQIGLFII
ncbi:DUF1294 domain-containing protein [Clostridium sp. CCUG 7971]|uniref:DUF1294 domain-containing protein n=1 Tax=Clostridium sp. CCUG 7971 TaxID=2811414 RepID=UPI001ABAFCB3|nr:DUF1294 domain-containing protein [Clostridium sp. CCUG 7971]MBO3445524.1 DUF1294 domain-containing protein [Clostridium sp. CCUG 7971]